MESLKDVLRRAMEEKKMSIRKLEAAIGSELKQEQKVSRNLIHEYLSGKRAPTYKAAAAISDVLELNKKEFLLLTFYTRQEQRKASEKERFLEYCRAAGIKVTGKDLKE